MTRRQADAEGGSRLLQQVDRLMISTAMLQGDAS